MVPKADLITSLDALIATDSLHVAPALAEAESLRESSRTSSERYLKQAAVVFLHDLESTTTLC